MNLNIYRKMALFSIIDSAILGTSWLMSFFLYRISGGFTDVRAHISSPFFRNRIATSIMIYFLLVSIPRYWDLRDKNIFKIRIKNISMFVYMCSFILTVILGTENYILYFVSIIFVVITMFISLIVDILTKFINRIIDKIILLYKANLFLIMFCFLLIFSGFFDLIQKHRSADIPAIFTYLVLLAGIIEEVIISYKEKTNDII